MLIVAQFPLVDVRPFLPEDTGRIKRPEWPDPPLHEYHPFIKGFGPAEKRQRGGLTGWAGEGAYCDVRRAIRFVDQIARPFLPVGTERLYLRCAYRRFFSAGKHGSSRFEVGLGTARRKGTTIALDAKDCEAVVRSALQFPVRVPAADAQGHRLRDLARVGRPLADAYLRSTTRRQFLQASSTASWWVSAGAPMVLIEYDSAVEQLDAPGVATQVAAPDAVAPADGASNGASNGAAGTTTAAGPSFTLKLHHQRVAGVDAIVWFLGRDGGDPQARDLARRTRVHLSRLHAEIECLGAVFRLIDADKLVVQRSANGAADPAGDLQQYLDNAASLLAEPRRDGIDQDPIFDALRPVSGGLAPADQAQFLARFKLARATIKRRIETLVATPRAEVLWQFNGPISGGLNVRNDDHSIHQGAGASIGDGFQAHDNTSSFIKNSDIRNSFNTIEKSAAAPQLKDLLKQLHAQVEEVAKSPALDDDARRDLTRDLTTLTSEATAAKPNRKWYELSADGLVEAAKKLGDVAAPVITTVKAVVALLA